MCVTLGPAKLSNTILYAAEVEAPQGLVHVLGYQNNVQNLASEVHWDWPERAPKGGNAMILPFPAAEAMTKHNVLETKNCKHILTDIAEVLRPGTRGAIPGTLGITRNAKGGRIEIFNHDIYTIVLAENADDIPNVLPQIPAEKRPAFNNQIFEAYAKWYPKWQIALCCFNNKEAATAAPLLWWYKPLHPEYLFAPALDCHTGKAPDLRKSVLVDHVVAVGSYLLREGAHVHYQDTLNSTVYPYLRPYVIGAEYHYAMPNGDFVCRLSDIRRELFNPKRLLPPGA